MQLSWFCFWMTVGVFCLLVPALAVDAASAVGGGGPAERPPAAGSPATGERRVREPAVAGLLYPQDPQALSRAIDGYLQQAKPHAVGGLRALICPHAGYTYSGPVAAHGYRLLQGRDFETVVVLAPSHYAAFAGASVCAADVFRTPLGEVPISPRAAQLAARPPFLSEPRCRVQRPSWASQSSRPLPARGEETPETWEHADEVQVPFLQRVLGKFSLVPVVLGEVDPAAAAKVLAEFIEDRTFLVVSSDLSHYHPYAEAKRLDDRCVQAICRLDIQAMESQEACGRIPILALMHLARAKGWKARLLDCRNSGDVTEDRQRGVVGYAAIAFYAPAPGNLSTAEKKLLLEAARKAVRSAAEGKASGPGESKLAEGRLGEFGACFVTLTKGGALRGCIGHILPVEPLGEAVVENACNAAVRDPRFPPLRPEEVDQLEIEISVLTVPQPLVFGSPEELLGGLRPHQHGVVLEVGGRRSTFLPQVWTQIPEKEHFLDQLSVKAGCAAGAWRGNDVRVSVYEVESFEESEVRGGK